MEKHFLEKYKTQNKPEVKKAAERKEKRTGEKGIYQDRSLRIQAYIERLENVFLNPDPKVRKRNIELLKPAIYENTLIKPQDFPESHFEFHKQQLVDRGIPREQVEENFDAEQREQEIGRVIESQKMSLDSWIDYLTGDDCKDYHADVKYFAIEGVLKLGTFDTEKYSFNKRKPTNTAPFAEIDHEALPKVLGAVEAKNYGESTDAYSKDLLALIDKGNSFGDMYALTMRELDQKAEKSDLLHIVDGKWKVFNKNSDPQELVNALAGKRSNLCIANIGDATTYLDQGTVEVYFSYNRAKQLTSPRIAIVYDEEKGGVYEVRGTYNKNEDTDPDIEESGILMERLKDLPNGESFAKKDADMKKVTEIYKKCFSVDRKTKEKSALNPTLTKKELQFLYEINGNIEGFGYQKDPRIAELREGRNVKDDLSFVLGVPKEQISTTQNEALSGNIVFHYGNLDLFSRTDAKGITLPQSIGGYLNLFSLRTAEGLTLPQSIGGYLNLNGLTTAEGLTLPQSIGGDLDLSSLTTAEGLTLPQSIGGSIHLSSLRTAEGLTLPQSIAGDLNLNSLKSAEGLTLPQSIGGDLNHYSLESAEGLTLPQSIGGYLYLNNLTDAEGLALPQSIGGGLNLENLTNAEGLILPQSIGGDLYLNNLTDAKKQELRNRFPHLAEEII
ncbi:MAG: hypothetical protein Q8Q18_00190 [bacterium]|nr:hypothetical protein [bacterium]